MGDGSCSSCEDVSGMLLFRPDRVSSRFSACAVRAASWLATRELRLADPGASCRGASSVPCFELLAGGSSAPSPAPPPARAGLCRRNDSRSEVPGSVALSSDTSPEPELRLDLLSGMRRVV
eukprot:scaffold91_cov254-Pinguiococcus_pyrenoidosus.AAC.19